MKRQFLSQKNRIGVVLLSSILIGSLPVGQILLLAPQVNAQSVTSSRSQQLNIREQGYLKQRNHKTYEFRGQAKQTVTISLTSIQFDTYLELYNPSGLRIAANNNQDGTNSQIRLNLPSSGTYTVVVKGVKKSAQGKYVLSIKGESSIQSPINLNSHYTNYLSRGEKNRYPFQARTGQLIVITLKSPQFNPHLALYGTDGRLLIEAKDFDSSNSQIQMRLPSTGVYTVQVSGIKSDAEGKYTLAIATS